MKLGKLYVKNTADFLEKIKSLCGCVFNYSECCGIVP